MTESLSFLHGQQKIQYKRFHGLPSAGAVLGDLAVTEQGWQVFGAGSKWEPVAPGDHHPDLKNLMKVFHQYKVLTPDHKWGSRLSNTAIKKRKLDQGPDIDDKTLPGPKVAENMWAFELYRELIQKPFDNPHEEAKQVVLSTLELLASHPSVISRLTPAPVLQPQNAPFPSIEAVIDDLLQEKTMDYMVLGQGRVEEDAAVSVFLTRFMCRRAQDPLVACMAVDATTHGIAACSLDFKAMLAGLGPDVAIRSNADAFTEAELACLVPLTPHEPSKSCLKDYGLQRKKALNEIAQLEWVSAGLCPAGWMTGMHIDHSGLAQLMVHCGGKKLWLIWPPTAHNLGWWGHKHPVDLNLREVLTAIEVLQELTVIVVEDRCSFILPPFSLHVVVSFTAAAHVGIIFAHDMFWPAAQVGLTFIKKLVRDHRAYGSSKARQLIEAVQDELQQWDRLKNKRGAEGVREWLSDTEGIYDTLIKGSTV